jgi:N-acetylneuraminic acid mutarotase
MSRGARHWLVIVAGLVVALAFPLSASALTHLRGSWTHISALPDDATISTAVGGRDGLLYVFGVCSSECIQTNGIVHAGAPVTYIYDPQFELWMSGRGAPRVCAGAEASLAGADGRIRLAGCWTDILTDDGFRIAVYNPATNSWLLRSSHGPYVNPIAGVVTPNGHAMWYGETLRRDQGAVFVSGHRIVEQVNGVWLARAKEPAGGPSDGAGLGTDGKVYVAGGDRNCFPQFGTCEIPKVAAWSPNTNVWSRPTTLPVPRMRVAVTADVLGRIFTIGGLSANGAMTFDTVQLYSPAVHTWFAVRRLPSPLFGAVATYTPDGRVWVIGGYDDSGTPLSDGYVFSDR